MTTTARLTWFRLHASTTVIDFPLHSPTAARAWVATMWPDTRIAGGWQRQFWQPGPAGRGFVPAVVELGDVLQFGIEHQPAVGAPPDQPPEVSLWHGYLHAVRGDSILVHGPHPGPRQTLAAAQQALIQQIHQSGHTPDRPAASGRATQLSAPEPGIAITPAQPPTTLTVTFDGAYATVGDPTHGWLVVPTDQLMTAMTRDPRDLAGHLAHHVRLSGREPPLTLAALAAQHAPQNLQAPSPSPTGPTGFYASGPPTAGSPRPPHPHPSAAPVSTPPETSL